MNDVALTALVDGTVVALRRDTPVAYARDSTGNALGGIRNPKVDVPMVALGGTKSTVQSRLVSCVSPTPKNSKTPPTTPRSPNDRGDTTDPHNRRRREHLEEHSTTQSWGEGRETTNLDAAGALGERPETARLPRLGSGARHPHG